MDPICWGSSMWTALHAITFYYPEKPTFADRQRMRQFFDVLPGVLPCPECTLHFQKLLQQYPVDQHLQSREVLSTWLVRLHNLVNERLHKPQQDYQAVKNYYEAYRASCPTDCSTSCKATTTTTRSMRSTTTNDTKSSLLWLLIPTAVVFILIVCMYKRRV